MHDILKYTSCPQVYKALRFATIHLACKVRGKIEEPAICHAQRVALIVSQLFCDNRSETLQTALLHDVLEDGSTNREVIRAIFDPPVADAVLILTKPEIKTRNWKKQFLKQIAAASEVAVLVKLADFIDNLSVRNGLGRATATALNARSFLALLGRRERSAATRRAVDWTEVVLAETARQNSCVVRLV